MLIRNLWQLKTVFFLHWCPIHTVVFAETKSYIEQAQLSYLGAEQQIKGLIFFYKVFHSKGQWANLIKFLTAGNLKFVSF